MIRALFFWGYDFIVVLCIRRRVFARKYRWRGLLCVMCMVHLFLNVFFLSSGLVHMFLVYHEDRPAEFTMCMPFNVYSMQVSRLGFSYRMLKGTPLLLICVCGYRFLELSCYFHPVCVFLLTWQSHDVCRQLDIFSCVVIDRCCNRMKFKYRGLL